MRIETVVPVMLMACVAMAPPSRCWADFEVVRIHDSVVDGTALTIEGRFRNCINGLSFQQSALLSHRGHQYVAYYDADRYVCVARRALPEGDWEKVRFTDYDFKSNDAHNVISMGICPKDGTIHLAFDHHGNPLHYRASKAGLASTPKHAAWNAECFGPITSQLEPGKDAPSVTYPRFWPTPEGALQFCYRRDGSGNGDRMLVDYDPARGVWHGARQIDSRKGVWRAGETESTVRCSYPNGYDYGPLGKLHVTWVWREGPHTANHDLMYAYSDDQGRTWNNSAAQPLNGPPRLDSPGVTVVEIPHTLGLMNTHGQAVDSQGRVHVVVWHCTEESLKAAGSTPGALRWGPPEARRYHHYWRNAAGDWLHRELPGVAGNRPKILVDKEDNAVAVFGSVHGSAGDLCIAAATAASEWTDWKTVHVEAGTFINEMLADVPLWKEAGVLSILVQESPGKAHQPTALRVIDFTVSERDH